MNKLRRLSLLSVVFLVCLIWTQWDVRAEERVLSVGILASLSGSQAPVGTDLRDGALLAIQEINEAWVHRGVKVTAFVEDDASEPEQAKRAVDRLIERNVDLVFGIGDSDCALAVMPMVSHAQIPMMTVATHAGLTKPHQKWIFRGNMSDADRSQILTDYLWDRLQEKKIALLYEDTEYGRSGAEAQKARLAQYKASPVSEASYARGVMNLSSEIQRIQAAGAKGILIYGQASDAHAVLQAVQERGMDVIIMASSGWDARSISDLSPELTQGVIVAGYLAFAQEDREEIFGPSWRQFDQAYRKRFGRAPGVMSAHAYSAMMCVGQAYERMDFQAEKLREGLEKTKTFATLLETLINFHDEDHDGVKFIHFTEFRDGQILVWKRNKMVREQRFQARGESITIGKYRGKIYDAPMGTTMWMVLHYALGRPPFIKDFQIMDEYGLKSSRVGTLFKEKTKLVVYQLTFRSEEDAINALNLAPFGEEELPAQVAETADQNINYRDMNWGIYTDGTYWAGFKRVENVVALGAGDAPREDLLSVIDTISAEGISNAN
jgi:branched-chain amino acid transport system substrate-binding protein